MHKRDYTYVEAVEGEEYELDGIKFVARRAPGIWSCQRCMFESVPYEHLCSEAPICSPDNDNVFYFEEVLDA